LFKRKNIHEDRIFNRKLESEDIEMKKTVALLLALCMVFALCACGSQTAARPRLPQIPIIPQ